MNFTGIKYVLVIISLGINCRHISRLRKKYAVSYSPIKTAYQSLEREGYIHLSTKVSIVIEQPKTVKENIASKLDEMLQTALDFGAAKEDIVEAIDFIMEKYC